MPKDIDQFKENVRISFKKAKEDIHSLHEKMDILTDLLAKLAEKPSEMPHEQPPEPQISQETAQEAPRIEEAAPNSLIFDKKEQKMPQTSLNQNSTGSEGVYSFIHSFNKYSFNMHSDVQLFISKLTKQELLTFLTIYQLEEDKSVVSYPDIASKIGLSEGCIRTYISSLIRKGAPVIKSRFNNKTIYLSINPEFRNLKLKQLLIDTYYRNDPHQRQLSDGF